MNTAVPEARTTRLWYEPPSTESVTMLLLSWALATTSEPLPDWAVL